MSIRALLGGPLLVAVVSACSAQPDTVTLDCESGHTLSVTVKDDHAHFAHNGKQHALPSESQGKYRSGDMTLKLTGSEASLRVGDQVIIWGCDVSSD